ncbi:MAG: hypothetical protein J3K34DRAFT_521191 [Monoraphidium minutum]|nr:MAG: hypothetical protein J3K34DRAFT_521191 [Monoraphidium minutum]
MNAALTAVLLASLATISYAAEVPGRAALRPAPEAPALVDADAGADARAGGRGAAAAAAAAPPLAGAGWQAGLTSPICAAGGPAARRVLVLAAPGGTPPPRRAPGAPALAFGGAGAGAGGGLPPGAGLALSLANRALLAAEPALFGGRAAPALRVAFDDVRGATAAAARAAGCGYDSSATAAAAAGGLFAAPPGPWAVFDASSGTLVVDRGALELLESAMAPPGHAAAAARLVAAAVDALAGAAQQAAVLVASQATPLAAALPTLAAAATAAVPAALAAAAAGGGLGAAAAALAAPPVWFCIACVAAMGLLAPLVINYLVGEAAQIACERLSLDTQECLDLFVAALGVALVLSLLSVVPIYPVCRLAECAHPGGGASRPRGGAPTAA